VIAACAAGDDRRDRAERQLVACPCSRLAEQIDCIIDEAERERRLGEIMFGFEPRGQKRDGAREAGRRGGVLLARELGAAGLRPRQRLVADWARVCSNRRRYRLRRGRRRP
jgi:hypothetical protein